MLTCSDHTLGSQIETALTLFNILFLYTICAHPARYITAIARTESHRSRGAQAQLRPQKPQKEYSQPALRATPAQSIQTPAHTLHMGPLLQDL